MILITITVSITTVSIMTFNITNLSMMTVNITTKTMQYPQHNGTEYRVL